MENADTIGCSRLNMAYNVRMIHCLLDLLVRVPIKYICLIHAYFGWEVRKEARSRFVEVQGTEGVGNRLESK
jgi:hypothetical protein